MGTFPIDVGMDGGKAEKAMHSPLLIVVFLSLPLKAINGTIQAVTSPKRQGRTHSNQLALLYLCMSYG